jgi:hypothetical protein
MGVRIGLHVFAQPRRPKLPTQPMREFAASKSKLRQGKLLAFPWIPLAESELFNGLQPKKTERAPNTPP